MPQISIDQQLHYTAKMTSSKYFPNAIYANRDGKLEKIFACGGR